MTGGPARWRATLGDHVEALALSPDGTLVAAGSLAGDAVVLEVATGDVVAKLPEHPLGVLSLAWSPTATLAVGGQDGMVRRWDRAQGEGPATRLRGWVGALAWAPDVPLLAAAAGKRLHLLAPDADDARWLAEDATTITDLAWATNGRRVATASYGGVRWYDPSLADHDTSDASDEAARGPAAARPNKELAWKGSMLCVEVSPDGRWCAAGCQDDSVHVWRLSSGDDMSMSGYAAKVRVVAWDPSSRWLCVANVGDVTMWDFAGKGPQGTMPVVLPGHAGTVHAVVWHPDGDALATGGADGFVALWRPAGRSEHRPVQRTDLGAPVAHLAWSAPTATLVAGLADGSVVALDPA